jgi:hypothetical protein
MRGRLTRDKLHPQQRKRITAFQSRLAQAAVKARMMSSFSAARLDVGGQWQHDDYDVFDGDRDVRRIYLVDSFGGKEMWLWGVDFMLTPRKSYGRADSLDAAKVAFQGGISACR